MPRPVILIPPSRGKAPGGTGRPYVATLTGRHPLTAPRRELLDAIRRAGASGPGDPRDEPTMPAHRRYTGVVYGNAGLAAVDPRTVDVDVRIVSGLMGLAALSDPVPDYRLEFSATVPGLGGVATFWRGRLDEHLRELLAGRRVWDLLPGEHARMWPAGLRDDLGATVVRFVDAAGRPANAARTKVAKGRLVAHLLGRPSATPATVVRGADLGDGWRLTRVDRTRIDAVWAP
jgi:uncharacterized protein